MKPKILIIAGGLATRMHPITQEIPKCLVDVGGKPLIQHQIEFFRNRGYDRFVFCVAHLAQQVQEYFNDGSSLGVRIEYSKEPETLLGTAGAAKLAEHLIGDECIIYYGDNLTTMDFDALLAFHHEKQGDFTIVMREHPQGYASSSLITMDAQNRIIVFGEKPSPDTFEKYKDKKTYINNGIYVMSRKIFSFIPENTKYDFAKNLIPDIIAKNMSVVGYVSNDFFRELGRVGKYEQFRQEIGKKGRVL